MYPPNSDLSCYSYNVTPILHLQYRYNLDKILAAKTHFCSFIASNTRHPRTTRKRNDFFRRLSRYKKVDAGGRAFNNMGYRVPGGPWGKIEFLKRYKFNIAFENASLPGYTTEKIVEPMAARCLPIYWGNPLIHREFNPKSFLNYFDFRDEAALIERIIELDQNDALYRQQIVEPYFHDNRPNEFFSLDRVLDHFDMIFSTTIRPVARRRLPPRHQAHGGARPARGHRRVAAPRQRGVVRHPGGRRVFDALPGWRGDRLARLCAPPPGDALRAGARQYPARRHLGLLAPAAVLHSRS